jgi:DNA-binding Xre family transcriptional regulator
MLNYNLDRLFMQRGIGNDPIPFLIEKGFTRGQASRLVNGKLYSIPVKNVEKLCLAFRCTPNDLLEWKPDNANLLKENQPLQKLISSDSSAIDWRSVNADIPFDRIPELVEKINEIKKEIMRK